MPELAYSGPRSENRQSAEDATVVLHDAAQRAAADRLSDELTSETVDGRRDPASYAVQRWEHGRSLYHMPSGGPLIECYIEGEAEFHHDLWFHGPGIGMPDAAELCVVCEWPSMVLTDTEVAVIEAWVRLNKRNLRQHPDEVEDAMLVPVGEFLEHPQRMSLGQVGVSVLHAGYLCVQVSPSFPSADAAANEFLYGVMPQHSSPPGELVLRVAARGELAYVCSPPAKRARRSPQ